MNLKALHSISYGLYVIGSKKEDSFNGQIANTVIQICSDPATISVCINKENLTHEFITDSGIFTVSILSQDTPLSFIGLFGFKSGRDVNKLEEVSYKIGETGAPIIIDNTIAYMEAQVVNHADVHTHTIFIGKIVAAEVIGEGKLLTYAHYHDIKRGTTPKTAPSYVEERKEVTSKMKKYRCTVCGYIYEPEKGDLQSGIATGTPFEDLPEDWQCPICGASKDEFTIDE